MKRDQYIPHEVSMRNTSEVMNLIEKEGMEGYGIYWALMEYLRTQDDYIGDIEVLKSLARQLRVLFLSSRTKRRISGTPLLCLSCHSEERSDEESECTKYMPSDSSLHSTTRLPYTKFRFE